MMDPMAVLRSDRDELVSVVAVATADDHHDISLLRQLCRGLLSILRRLADRVTKSDLGLWKGRFKGPSDCSDAIDWLGGLSHDAIVFLEWNRLEIVLAEDDAVFVEIANQSIDLDVSRNTDNDGVAAGLNKRLKMFVGNVYERASRVMNRSFACCKLPSDFV